MQVDCGSQGFFGFRNACRFSNKGQCYMQIFRACKTSVPYLLFEQINCRHQRLADLVGKKNDSKQTHKPTSSIYHISSIADTFCYFQHKTIFAVVILAGVRRRSVFL